MKCSKLGDEYLLLKELGVGGYATVYKAKNLKYNYIRAIRVLDTHIESENEKIYQSFLRECGILLRLGNGCHPNIVRIYQPRHVDGRAFVEMDWIDGVDLRQLIAQYNNVVPIDETLRMVREIGYALAYCHRDIYKVCYDKVSDDLPDANDGSALITPESEERLIEKYRVIHNDIHTGNIMRHNDGSYILLDFGLAVDGKFDIVNSSRRQQGAIEFLSAQRLDGLTPTPQDDIYAFGCVIYAMLTGTPPFPVKKDKNTKTIPVSEQARVCTAHKEQQPPHIQREDAPQWLIDVTMRCLAKNPNDRFMDGYELYKEILLHQEESNVDECAMEQKISQLESDKVQLDDIVKTLSEDIKREKNNSESLANTLDIKIEECKTLRCDFKKLEKKCDELQEEGRRYTWIKIILIMALGAGVMALIMLLINHSLTNKSGSESLAKTTQIDSSKHIAVNDINFDSLVQKNADLEQQVANLSQELSNAKATYKYNPQEDGLSSKIQEQEKTIKTLNAQISDLKKNGSPQQQASIKQLKNTISSYEKQKRDWNTQRDVLNKKIVELSNRVATNSNN